MRELITDLHIHSQYAYATSKQMNTQDLYRWGKIKGINIQGTGDFTHPVYFQELQDKIELAEPGLFVLKDEFRKEVDRDLPSSVADNIHRFVLTVEISNIYSKGGKVRRLHNVIVMPDFDSVSELNSYLGKLGNLSADGRPTLGMDSKELLRVVLDINPSSLFFPAHIWTPWYAMFGSKSGFDSITEAFEELAPEIKAIETGLSSDPKMNLYVPEIRNRTILSNSDAHSPQKLGREATIIKSELSYKGIIGAIKSNDERLVGTIEFFPEEGKYHLDGHRKCNVSLEPKQSELQKRLCPVCKKPLTIGVLNRVMQLAGDSLGEEYKTNKKVEYIVPLAELIAEVKEIKNANSKTVMHDYNQLIKLFGDEFHILRNTKIEEIGLAGFETIAENIKSMRDGRVDIEPGYDGVYGKVSIKKKAEKQFSLI